MKAAKGIVITVIGLLAAAAGIVLMKRIPDPQGVMRALPYLCVGVGCGLFGHGVGEIANQRIRKKYPDLARQKDIDSQDERNVTIGNMAKAKGFDMATYVFGALLVAFALMGESLPVILPLVIAYLFIEGYAIYQRCRLDKIF